MPKRKSYVHVLVMALLLTGLSSTSFGQTPIPDLSFDLGDGLPEMGIRLIVPENLPTEKKLGLILGFHGHGGHIDAMVNYPTSLIPWTHVIESNTWIHERDEYVIIGLKSANSGYTEHMGDWEGVDIARVKWILDWALDNYPIDPRRVHLVGNSRGAFMATRFAWAHPKDIASVYAVAGAYSPGWDSDSNPAGWPKDWYTLRYGTPTESVDNVPTGNGFDYQFDFSDYSKRKILQLADNDSAYLRAVKQATKWRLQSKCLPGSETIKDNQKITVGDYLPEFYHIHGFNDTTIDVGLTRSFTRELAQKGIKFIYREMDNGNHGNIFNGEPGYYENHVDGMASMHATRNDNFPLSEADQLTLATLKGHTDNNTLWFNQSYTEPLILEAGRIGGREAGEALIPALGNTLDSGVRYLAAREAKTTKFGPAFTAKLGELIYDTVPNVSTHAIQALGQYAKWRQSDAQTILINAALDTDLAQDIRLQVIDALGGVFNLIRHGNMHDDKVIVETLVKLLSDSDPVITTKAHDFLVTTTWEQSGWIDPGTGGAWANFGLAATAEEVAAAIAAWNYWLGIATAPLLNKDLLIKKPSEE